MQKPVCANDGTQKFTYSILIFLVLSSIFAVLFPFSEIFTHIPLAQNEGWNAYQIDRVINPALGPLYPDPQNGLIFNNYPPLSFYIVGYFSKYVTHDVMIAGRIVSFLFMAASCFLCSMCVKSLGGKPIGIILSFFIPFLYTAMYFGWWFATNDPQWVSIFFVLISLYISINCIKSNKDNRYFYICLAAFFSVVAGTAKHNEFSIPLAITILLLLNDRKVFYTWCASGIVFTILAFLGLEAIFGRNMIEDVFFHPRVMSLSYLKNLRVSFGWMETLYIAAIPCLFEMKDKKLRNVIAIIFTVCFVLGICQRAGEGVSDNAQIDTLIALAIVIGMGVSVFPEKWQGYRTPSMILLTVISIAPPVIKSVTHLPGNIKKIRQIPAQQKRWDAIYNVISSNSRPSACRMLSICYWAGQPYTVDMFNLGQYLKLNGKNKIIYNMVKNKYFGIIEYSYCSDKNCRLERDALFQNGLDNYHTIKIEPRFGTFDRFDDILVFYAPND
ncbi:glycosyltransferase family 39 protein [Komagataeibacter xylinus]|uniref:glycosyltransferase family 39 protein n=1 Tax=Komagataeibacter xylinus TaxID=28448 RepID=UPI000FDF6AE5|nr:glycosyltransferase family 39 protein [Komagataeibacter xylinus]AZV39309.1 hypothetical protein CXP35_11460 [Komagataeibacter xylinus]